MAHKNKNDGGKRTNTAQSRLLRSKALTLNTCRSFDYARGNGPIIYFTDLCKPIEACIYARTKITHLQVIPQQSTQKHSKFAITDIREKPVNFFCCST